MSRNRIPDDWYEPPMEKEEKEEREYDPELREPLFDEEEKLNEK